MERGARPGKIPALTGIRFFAAFYVFVYHYGATFLDHVGAPRPVAIFLHNGDFGVAIFFILSGFILSHAHPGPFESVTQYGDYFTARFARVYPVYLFALMLALPFALPNLNVKAAVAVLAMVQSWTDGISEFGKSWMTPAWTLSVECFFYLFFPFLITVLRRLQIPALLALCAIDTIFMISGGTSTVQPGTDYAHVPNWSLHLFLPLTRSSEFVFGMLLHTLSTRAQGLARGHGTAPCLLLTATVVVLLSITANDRVIGVAAVLVGLLIGLIYVSDNGFTRLLGWRPIYVLGGASYALYLLQSPVHAYLVLLFDSFGRILAFPVTLGASLLVWRFVEEPARRSILRHRAGAVARAPVAN